jgi:hypothetical protein
MGRVCGTPRKVTINGLTYDAVGDADITINSNIEKEGLPTSGRTMFKHTRKNPDMESVGISADPSEYEVLMQESESLVTFPMSLTFADGSVFRAVGGINVDTYTSADNIATIKMIPDNAKLRWELFAAA